MDTSMPDTCPNCGAGRVRLTSVCELIESDWIKTSQGTVYYCGALLEAHYAEPRHGSPIIRQVVDGCPAEEGALKKWSLKE